MFLLTLWGIERNASITMRFLKTKMEEYEALREAVKQVRREAD
jgi:hypothetical protein